MSPTTAEIASALEGALGEPDAPEVSSAFLFGSVAEERDHRESDVDLGVLLSWSAHASRAERFDAGIRLAGRLRAELGREVDVVVLNDAPPLLGRHIVTEGRRLACRDEAADFAYRRDVQLRAADLEPWLRRMRELKLRAIRG